MSGGRPELLFGLPPILDAGVSTLILGSFPSPASLAAQQYYAHRQNQFWRLLGALLGEPLAELDYTERQRCLLHHGIGAVSYTHLDVYKRQVLPRRMPIRRRKMFRWLTTWRG